MVYKRIHSEETDDWPSALKKATFDLNHISRPQLGGKTSASIQSNADDVELRLAREQYAKTLTAKEKEKLFPHQPSWQELEAATERQRTGGTTFKIGDYVLLEDLKRSKLAKSFQIQRKEVFLVTGIFYGLEPLRYKITDMKRVTKGVYYGNELRKSPLLPTDPKFWTVSKVVGEKMEEESTFYLCRFDGFNYRFDRYLPPTEIRQRIIDDYLAEKAEKERKKEAMKAMS